jgi:hypothetical protein
MSEVLILTLVIAGIIIGGPSSFAVTNQDREDIPATPTEIAEVLHLYNLTFFEPRNEAHHLGLGIIRLSDYQDIDTTLKFIITKTLGKSYLLYQLYLNEGWRHSAEQITDEHSRHDITILSYNHLIGPDTMLVAGLVHSNQMLIKSQATKTVVLGIYHQLTPRTAFAIAAGPNISRGLSDFRVTAGFQFSFQ